MNKVDMHGIDYYHADEVVNVIEQLKNELRQWREFAEKMERMAVSFEDAIERNSRILGGRHDISSWVTKAKALREIIKLMPSKEGK